MIVAALLLACSSAPSSSPEPSPSPAGSGPATGPTATRTSAPTATAEPSPSVRVAGPSSPPTVGVVQVVDCVDSDWTGGDIDYGEGPTGGVPDLTTATRALRGVRWSDVVAVDGARSGVIRDGRAVFSALWSTSTSGGWLLTHYDACIADGVGFRPFGLRRDAIAEVVVDGGVRVRSLPTVDPASIKYEPLLARGDEVFIVDGPVQADGYDWYLVQALVDGGETGPFGWIAAAGRDGETWVDDAAATTCPSLPGDTSRLGVIGEEVLVHCLGGSEISIEIDAGIFCQPDDALPIEPAWMAAGCGYLSGDACGSCGFPVAADPQTGVLPEEEHAHWSIWGHFDDPRAATCRLATPAGAGDPRPELVVHRCRTTFVLTSLIRLGPAS